MHGERRRVGRRRQVAQAGPAHTGLALAGLTGQVGRTGRDVGRGTLGEAAQAARQQVDLGTPAGDGGHRRRGGGQVSEEHGAILTAGYDNPRG